MRIRRVTLGLCAAAALALFGARAAADGPAPLPEAGHDTIGYPSVDAALTALKARADVTVSIHEGWTVIEDPSASAFWSFPPKGYPAYPSAVRRTIVKNADGSYSLSMDVHCEAAKAACDDLVRKFQALNEQAKRRLGGQ